MKDKKHEERLIVLRCEDKIFQSFIIVWKLGTGMVWEILK